MALANMPMPFSFVYSMASTKFLPDLSFWDMHETNLVLLRQACLFIPAA